MINQNDILEHNGEPVRVEHYAHQNAISVRTLKGKGLQLKAQDLKEIDPDDYKPKTKKKI